MYLTGLKDDYEHDGRVVTQILANPNPVLSAKGVTPLGECYKQLNARPMSPSAPCRRYGTRCPSPRSRSAPRPTVVTLALVVWRLRRR